MINKIKLLAGSALMASLVLSPVLSFANTKSQSGKDEKIAIKTELKISKEDRENRKENKEKKNCLQVFAHLVGGKDWKNQTGISFDNCWLPFGIAKKFKDVKASTTPDTTSPVISNIVITPRIEKAKITWTTDEKTSSEVFYSTSSPVSLTGSTNVKTRWFEGKDKEHQVTIGRLSANTTYHLVIRSKDKAGNTSVSNEVTFTTLMAPADVTAPIISNVATVKATSTIQVGWRTNELATSRVYYGATSPINVNATSTTKVENNALVLNHVLTLPSLSASTTYFMVVESKDSSGNARLTDQFNVTTLGI